jgi:2-dehydropantoate 2-reductase
MNTEKEKRYLICGRGAVGLLLGIRLLKAGHDVTFLTRASALHESVSLDDITRGTVETVHNPRSISRENLDGKYDVLFICSKTPDLGRICALLPEVMLPSSIVVPFQNGLHMDRRVADLLGFGIVLSGTIYTNVSRVGTNTAKLVGGPNVVLGVRDQRNREYVIRIANTLCDAEIPTVVSSQVDTEQWKKFISLCAFSIITASSGKNVGQVMSDANLRQDLFDAVDEGLLVAQAFEALINIEGLRDHIRTRFQHQAVANSEASSSLSVDVAAGSIGELQDLSGCLIRLAESRGLGVPTHIRHYRRIIEGIHPGKVQAL